MPVFLARIAAWCDWYRPRASAEQRRQAYIKLRMSALCKAGERAKLEVWLRAVRKEPPSARTELATVLPVKQAEEWVETLVQLQHQAEVETRQLRFVEHLWMPALVAASFSTPLLRWCFGGLSAVVTAVCYMRFDGQMFTNSMHTNASFNLARSSTLIAYDVMTRPHKKMLLQDSAVLKVSFYCPCLCGLPESQKVPSSCHGPL